MIQVKLMTCKGNKILEGTLPGLPREGDMFWVGGIPHPVSHVAWEVNKDHVEVYLGKVC